MTNLDDKFQPSVLNQSQGIDWWHDFRSATPPSGQVEKTAIYADWKTAYNFGMKQNGQKGVLITNNTNRKPQLRYRLVTSVPVCDAPSDQYEQKLQFAHFRSASRLVVGMKNAYNFKTVQNV